MNNTSISNTNYCKPEYTNQYSYTVNDQPYYIYTSASTDLGSIYNTDNQWYYALQPYKWVTIGPYKEQSDIQPKEWHDPKDWYTDLQKMKDQWQIDPKTVPPQVPTISDWDEFVMQATKASEQKLALNTKEEEKKLEPQPVIDHGRDFDMDDDFDF